jgi:cytoskeletal protein CcmA (bactofilin family)
MGLPFIKEVGMALHFGKRENEIPKPLTSGVAPQRYNTNPGMAPGQGQNAGQPGQVPLVHDRLAEPRVTSSTSTTSQTGGSKLTVGPNIKLKGLEITDCDTLVVEGMVEATMDSRVIQIAEQGEFKGAAEVDIAEVHGLFEGELNVRQKLVIHGSGRVTGKIRYGKLVVEEGGQLSGDIECTVAARTAAPKPSMALAA